MKKYLILVSVIFLTACNPVTDPEGATKALEDLGFTDIQIGGYAFFACSEDEWNHTSFTAKNPQGKIVTGTVCSGLMFKNSTVRFN